MKIENMKVFGILDALRGMRNPLNSWDKNDSRCVCDPNDGHVIELELGPNDQRLCRALTLGGQPHRKFLRQILASIDITAPAYWWAEMDTYKISTTRNSCSVQHKGSSRDFKLADFTFDDFKEIARNSNELDAEWFDKEVAPTILASMNFLRRKYVKTKDYRYFRLMRQIMPMGYNYRATWTGTYENLLNIYEWRHAHKLVEWHEFCDEIKKLPGMEFFLASMVNKEK